MGNNFETEIPWANGKSVWVVWFDMECDGTREYVKKMFQPSKIDQVINFYWIPYIYKNEYKRFLKYRIQDRHCWIVNDHFLQVLRSEWYDVSDFDYLTLQHEYCARVPNPEQTWLDLHINYDEFLQKDKAHRDSIEKQADSKKDEQIANMQGMMKEMMEQMKVLQAQVWQPNVLLSKEITNDWTKSSWSDSTTNAEWITDWESTEPITESLTKPSMNSWSESWNDSNWQRTTETITPQENGEDWKIESENQRQNFELWWSEWLQQSSNWTQWPEQWGNIATVESDGLWTNPIPFKIWWEIWNQNTTWTEEPKKDRRNW